MGNTLCRCAEEKRPEADNIDISNSFIAKTPQEASPNKQQMGKATKRSMAKQLLPVKIDDQHEVL